MGRHLAAVVCAATLCVFAVDRWLSGASGAHMGRQSRNEVAFAVAKTEEEWRASLTPRQYAVLRQNDTEYPGTSPLLAEHRPGTFTCAGCGQELFDSATKYESGSGWPSFWSATEGAVGTAEDGTLGMRRTEIHCSRCGGHLGHVFPDGPKPTGLRYCTNGAALAFQPKAASREP